MAMPRTSYTGAEPYVFVCYSHENEDVVFAEIAWLQGQGVNVWYDERISAGTIWREEIAEALSCATHLLYFVSSDSVVSDHCKREIDFALGKERPVLPIYLEEVALPAEQALALNRVQALRITSASCRDSLLRSLQQGGENGPVSSVAAGPTPILAQKGWWFAGILTALVVAAVYVGLTLPALESRPLEYIFVDDFQVLPGSEALDSFAGVIRLDLLSTFGETEQVTIVDHSRESDLVLQGTVRNVAEGARVAIQLLRADSRELLWADDIDQATDLRGFSKSPFVARLVEAILSAHNGSLSVSDDPDARDAYFQGMLEWHKTTTAANGDNRVAERYFRRAIEFDPDLASAYGMLTTIYSNRLGWRLTAAEASQKAHTAVRNLLELEPDITFFLGKLNMDLDLDYEASEANLLYALANNWSNSTVVLNLGILRHLQGNLPEAINQLETALGVGANSDSAWALFNLAVAVLSDGKYGRALKYLEDAKDSALVEPIFVLLARCEAVFRVRGEEEAGKCVDEGWSIYGEERPYYFPGVLVLAGRHEDARTILEDMERQANVHPILTNSYAFDAYFHLGELDHAFVSLNRAIENRESAAIKAMKTARHLEPLRSDPRFASAMSRLAAIEAQGSPTISVAMQ